MGTVSAYNKWATTALALTTQEWHNLGLGDAKVDNFNEAVERMTALLLMRMVAVVSSPKSFKDLSTTCIAGCIAKSSMVKENNPWWPRSITNEVIGQLKKYVCIILKKYNKKAPYHNWKHAYHVFISTNKLLDLMLNTEHFREKKQPSVFGLRNDPIMHFALLFSALIHDVEHKGVPNRQLVMEGSELSLLYNDQSIQEQRALCVSFTELLKEEFTDLRGVLFPSTEEYRRFREAVLNLVLTTDIASPERVEIAKSKWKEAFGEKTEQTNGTTRPAGRRNSIVSDTSLPCSSRHSMKKMPWRGTEHSGKLCRSDSSSNFSNDQRHLDEVEDLSSCASRRLLSRREIGQKSHSDMFMDDPQNITRKMPRRASGQSICSVTSELTIDLSMGASERPLSEEEQRYYFTAESSGDEKDSTADKTDGVMPSGMPPSGHLNNYFVTASSVIDDAFSDDKPTGPKSLTGSNTDGWTPKADSSKIFSAPVAGQNARTINNEVSFTAKNPQGRRVARRCSTTMIPEETCTGLSSVDNLYMNTKERELYEQLYGDAYDFSPSKLHPARYQRRFSSASAAFGTTTRAKKYKKRLGILCSLDFSGEAIETFSKMSQVSNSMSGVSGPDEKMPGLDADKPDKLRATVVMETIMVAADVAHNLQGWDNMIEWSSRFFHELMAAHNGGRGDDPSGEWFDNQMAFLESVLLPLANRLSDIGVFGDLVGPSFSRIVKENQDQWLIHGHDVTDSLITSEYAQGVNVVSE